MSGKEKDMQELQNYYEARYNFEHVLLPAWFYDAGEDELQEIMDQDASFLWDKWKLVCEMEGLEMRDTKNPFKLSKRTIDNDCTIVRIGMPKPDKEYCCFQVYLVWSDDYENRKYFTVERSTSSKMSFLCSWTDEGEHGNYGPCSPNGKDIESRIRKLFVG